jgi:hypothetical protein
MYFDFGFKNVSLEDCIIVEGTRNFSGNEKKDRNTGRIRNNEGNRNFLIELDPDVYEEFKERGWNVGRFAAREDGVEPKGFMRVTVSYFKQPPIIHMISNGVDTPLGENRVHMLDSVNILSLDMRCTAVNKQNKDGEWKKYAYVDEMWVEVAPDRFATKYANLRRAEEEED